MSQSQRLNNPLHQFNYSEVCHEDRAIRRFGSMEGRTKAEPEYLCVDEREKLLSRLSSRWSKTESSNLNHFEHCGRIWRSVEQGVHQVPGVLSTISLRGEESTLHSSRWRIYRTGGLHDYLRVLRDHLEDDSWIHSLPEEASTKLIDNWQLTIDNRQLTIIYR